LQCEVIGALKFLGIMTTLGELKDRLTGFDFDRV